MIPMPVFRCKRLLCFFSICLVGPAASGWWESEPEGSCGGPARWALGHDLRRRLGAQGGGRRLQTAWICQVSRLTDSTQHSMVSVRSIPSSRLTDSTQHSMVSMRSIPSSRLTDSTQHSSVRSVQLVHSIARWH